MIMPWSHGFIGGPKWQYTERLAIAEKVEKSKERLKDPMDKQRSHITNLLLKTSLDKNLFLRQGSMLIYWRWSLYIAQTMLNWHDWFSAALSVVCQVWAITQGLSSVVHREAKERYDILIWIHKAWIKVLLWAFCLFDIGTSEDQLFLKGVSCETSHWHLLSSNSETQFLFTQQSRCTLSKWKS